MTQGEAIAHVNAGNLELEPELLAAKLGCSVMAAFDVQQEIVDVLAPMLFGQAIDEREAP